MQILDYEALVDILYGAAFLGGGGGGPLDIALDMLKKYEGKTVNLYDVDDLSSSDHVAVIAAMGNPTKAAGKDFNSILRNTFSHIKETYTDVSIVGVMAGECGGFNTFAPIYVALNNPGIMLVDADGAGRAVPGLDTSLVSVNGVSIDPFVLTGESDDWVIVHTKDSGDFSSPKKCEEIARKISDTPFFDDVSGIGGWVMNKEIVRKKSCVGGISRCRGIGSAIRAYRDKVTLRSDIFTYLSRNAGRFGVPGLLCECLIPSTMINAIDIKSAAERGFEYGTFYLNGENIRINYEVRYVNEFLYCSKITQISGFVRDIEIKATAPTIIVLFDEEKFIPVTDSILKAWEEKLPEDKMSLGLVSVADTWGRLGNERNTAVWRNYFDMVDYNGNCVDF